MTLASDRAQLGDTRREADHAADARFRFRDQQSLPVEAVYRRFGFQGREVVIENES